MQFYVFVHDFIVSYVEKVYFIHSLIHSFIASECVKIFRCSCKASACDRCAHVTAVLLYLDNYVNSNGYVVNSPSTSKP